VVGRPYRLVQPPRRLPLAGLGVSAAVHLALVAGAGLALMWGVGARPKTYVVNLVPAVAAVGMPAAPRTRTAPPAPVEDPKPPAPRVVEPSRTALPEPAPRPLPPRQTVRLPEPSLPTRALPVRSPTIRPGDKEAPPLLPQPAAAPRPERRVEPRAVAAPPPPPPSSAVPGQRQGSPAGVGALTLDASDFPHAWYLRQVLQKVQGEWQRQPPVTEPDQRPLILVEIQRDGSIRTPSVQQTSGSAFYDQAALRAVVAASPFPPLPQDWSRAALRIMFRFELERS
jgi:protein TonB